MFAKAGLSVLSLLAACLLSLDAAATTLRVISDRTPSHLESLFKYYEQNHGVTIEAVFVKKGLIARLKSRPTEADLVITNSADILEQARRDGLLQAYSSKQIEGSIDDRFQDPDNAYLSLSYRPRSIFASRSRVEPGAVSTYEDLTDPKWRGRICIRSGYHQYNLNLFAQIAADRGLDYAREFLTGLHANLARTPNGNDRAQVRAIYEGQCDLSVGNSYYMPLMLGNDEQRPWGESSYLIFPDQQGAGAYILRGGAALTTATGNVKAATALLEFLISTEAQNFIVNSTYEYPVNDDTPLPAVNRELGKGQPGVTDGRFKVRDIPLTEIADMRPAIITLLDEINFDNK